MKVSLFSFLARLMPQVEAEPRGVEEDSQTMLSLKPAVAPTACNSEEPNACVPENTSQPRKPRSVLSFPVFKAQEFVRSIKSLPFFKPVEQPPVQALTVNEEETPAKTIGTSESIIADNMEPILNDSVDKLTASLALSKNILDVANAFRQIDAILGKNDYVLALMGCIILEFKSWEKFGYLTMTEFLSDLAKECGVSRQAFYQAGQAGKVIRFLAGPMFRISGQEPYASLNSEVFYRNFSKVKFLYRILFVWGLAIEDEVLTKFKEMSYRDFENFMRAYAEQKKDEIKLASRSKMPIRGDPYKYKEPKPLITDAQIRKHRLTEVDVERLKAIKLQMMFDDMAPKPPKPKAPKPPKPDIPKLIGLDVEIYREIRLGHKIGFLTNTEAAFVESVFRYFNDDRRRKAEDLNAAYIKSSQIVWGSGPSSYYTSLDWAELVPERFSESILYLERIITDYLPPNEIKAAFAERFKKKSDLTLVQGYLVWRIKNEAELSKSVSQYVIDHNINSPKWDIVKRFFMNVLDVEESRYKYLARISLGLALWPIYVGNLISFTSDGCLEKLSYLPTAVKNHRLNPELVSYAFTALTTQRFKEFARNKFDNDLSSEPIIPKDYLKAKPFIDKLHSFQSEGKAVTIIGLKTEEEVERLEWINRAKEFGSRDLRNRFPGIVWDSNAQGHEVEAKSEIGVNEEVTLNPDEKVTEDARQQDAGDFPMITVA